MDLKKSQFDSNLTDSQYQALLGLSKWYASDNAIGTLMGAAGTGKTYLLNVFLRTIATQSACVTAPTHKAVRVIEKMTGKKGRTIHSLHGLRPDVSLEDFNLDNVKFSSLGKSSISNYKIVPCDESGMINKSLDTLNETRAKQFHTKILYLGDEYQLPPVKEAMSATFIKYSKFELTEIVRQNKEHPLTEPLLILRNDIKQGTNKFMQYIATHKGHFNDANEGYRVHSLKDFQDKSVELFSAEAFLGNLDYVRYMGYTNDNINDWNKFIRKKTNTLVATNDDIINEDDMFTSYKTIVDDFLTPIIVNSEDYIVDDVRRYKNEYDMEVFIVSFKNAITLQVSRSVQVVDHTNTNTLQRYYLILKGLLEDALYCHASEKGAKWKAFFNFKNTHLSMITFPILDSNKQKIGQVMKDIDYGHGITVHKSQGSTYENSMINIKNINKILTMGYPDFRMRNRLIYVALSRTSKQAHILL